MNLPINTLQRLIARWRAEHALVASEAAAVNLLRARTAGWVVALLDALIVLVLATLVTGPADAQGERWRFGLLLVHLAMGMSMLILSLAAHRLRYAHSARLRRDLPVLLAAVGLAFAIGITTIDQWVTPNITPLLIGAMAISMAIHLRPFTASTLFLGAYLLFFFMIGLTQADADRLLSNRINGLVAVALAWALSVMLWRNFTVLALQRMQLEATNAELQAKQKELQRLTRLDGLTGLYNRNTFVELTRQELARAQRQSSNTAILLLDLDHFKRVNDTWGHPAGDAVLKNVALVANNTVRGTDLVGRLGGEEFIILLPATSVEAARRLAEKLRANLERCPGQWEGQSIRCTASIGVAGTSAAENHDFDHLYGVADKALYAAKEKGRNRVM